MFILAVLKSLTILHFMKVQCLMKLLRFFKSFGFLAESYSVVCACSLSCSCSQLFPSFSFLFMMYSNPDSLWLKAPTPPTQPAVASANS